MEQAKRNAENRSKQTLNHTSGTKSYARSKAQYNKKHGEDPDPIWFFQDKHTRRDEDHSWVNSVAEQKYDHWRSELKATQELLKHNQQEIEEMRQMLSRSSASHHPLYQQLPNPFHMSYYSPQMFHQMPYQAKSVTPTGGLTGLLRGDADPSATDFLESDQEEQELVIVILTSLCKASLKTYKVLAKELLQEEAITDEFPSVLGFLLTTKGCQDRGKL
ncbi:hypothetical protein ACE6H2_026246 [Prunus campanulata]